MKKNETIKKIIKILDDTKVQDIKIYDIRQISSITDYLLICHTESSIQNKAILKKITKICKPIKSDIDDNNEWIVLDYFDFILHVFTKDLREHYNIDDFWYDCKVDKI